MGSPEVDGHGIYLQNVYVKLIIIGHGKDDRVEHSQLLQVVRGNVPQFYAGPVPDDQRWWRWGRKSITTMFKVSRDSLGPCVSQESDGRHTWSCYDSGKILATDYCYYLRYT